MKILLLGATGYAGGEFCQTYERKALLKAVIGDFLAALRKEYPSVEIHAVVRNPANAEAVLKAGASETHIASHKDSLFKDLVSEFELVINAADSFDTSFSEVLIEGLTAQKVKKGAVGTLIHLSGCASFVDMCGDGKYNPNGRVWTVC